MSQSKECIGGPLVINGRTLSLSKAVRADNFVFLTGQVPMQDGVPMTTGSVEDQTRCCIESIRATLRECGGDLSDIVKSTVWLKERDDFPGFNSVYTGYFTEDPPARTGLVSDFLIDIRVEIECVAYIPTGISSR
jgi:2-iminobutanoate/2-iminopropanoate deaminase